MNFGDVAAWVATALFPSTAVIGVLFRRWFRGPLAVRLRPHFICGYAVLVLAGVHVMAAMPAMRTLNANDAWLATVALGGVGLQTFLGASLQSPGIYRLPLRRWHLVTMCLAGVAIAGHVAITR